MGFGVAEEALEGWIPAEDQSEGFGAIPVGPYRMIVSDIEPKDTISGGFAWHLTLKVNDGGPAQGRTFHYYMNWTAGDGSMSGGMPFTQMALKALGIQYVSNTGQPMPVRVSKRDIIGREVVGIVDIQATGQYAGRNQVGRLEPLGGTVPGVTQPPPGPAGFPPQQAPAGYPPQQAPNGFPPPAGPPPGWNVPPAGPPQQQWDAQQAPAQQYPTQPPQPTWGGQAPPQQRQPVPGGRPPGIDF